MATKAEEKTIDPMEEYVPVRLFKDNDRYKDDVFVSCNGERVQIKRGETVMIKRKFAEILEQSQLAKEQAAMRSDELSAEYQAEANRLGIR